MIYDVTFVNEATGEENTICVSEDEYIYDAAELEGIELPASCRSGSCITCVSKVVNGDVEHDHSILSDAEEDAGFMLTCCAYARSNCTILVNQEDELLDFSTVA